MLRWCYSLSFPKIGSQLLVYFPKKVYKGTIYEEGIYESLVVSLGSGKGDNWWCVLFPPICMIEAKKNDKDNIEYKSKVLEILNNYK